VAPALLVFYPFFMRGGAPQAHDSLLANPGFITLFHRYGLSIRSVARLPGNILEVSEFWVISRIGGAPCLLCCPALKGDLIMAMFSVVTGARLLGFHPKTL
jgi:hypothetical protein